MLARLVASTDTANSTPGRLTFVWGPAYPTGADVTLHIPENILILADWTLAAIVDDTMPPRNPNDDDEEDEEGEDEEKDDEPPVVREPEPEE
jgi:hypothetical protein